MTVRETDPLDVDASADLAASAAAIERGRTADLFQKMLPVQREMMADPFCESDTMIPAVRFEHRAFQMGALRVKELDYPFRPAYPVFLPCLDDIPPGVITESIVADAVASLPRASVPGWFPPRGEALLNRDPGQGVRLGADVVRLTLDPSEMVLVTVERQGLMRFWTWAPPTLLSELPAEPIAQARALMDRYHLPREG